MLDWILKVNGVENGKVFGEDLKYESDGVLNRIS